MSDLIQILIFLFSASAIWFVGRRENWRRWGYVLGLCGQPFWLYTTFISGQWGMFVLSVWYSYSWGQGVYNFFIRKNKKRGF